MIRKLKNWFLRNFVCRSIFVDGHMPIKEVRETDVNITQYKCKRCDCTLGIGYWKYSPPPPNRTPEQLKQWEKFKQAKFSRLRAGDTSDNL